MDKPTLNLVVGTLLQLETPDHHGAAIPVTLIGYVPGRSIMVMLAASAGTGARLALRTGDPCVVRFESGDSLYAFDTQVLWQAEQPFIHVHLAYPQGVQGALVRRSPRVQVNDMVMMLVMEEAGRKLSVALADISLLGARLVAGGLGVPSPMPTPTGPLVMRKRGMPSSSMALTWRSMRIWAASRSISSFVVALADKP